MDFTTYEFAEGRLQEAALIIMAIVYTLRLIWIMRFPAGKERQAPTGKGGLKNSGSIIYSWMNIGMPWGMESSRKQFFLYVQFAIFHLGVVAAADDSAVLRPEEAPGTAAPGCRRLQLTRR